MRTRWVVAALALMILAPVRADPSKVAVFDFELVGTSLRGGVDRPRRDEYGRLMPAGNQPRRELEAPVRLAAQRERDVSFLAGGLHQFGTQLLGENGSASPTTNRKTGRHPRSAPSRHVCARPACRRRDSRPVP